ncbi:MAG: hypothetical protein LBG62_06510 [Candidatus Methanoplasma sp.]|jgi:hypothetical protein|nr:hypothetical protein [Candidatus Methanoplasma sp.]
MKRVLVVTNDSSVFLRDGIASAFEMFGGRMTEVKNLVARLDSAERGGRKLCDVSFGVISSRYGFVPGNFVIMRYAGAMSCREDYERVQSETGYIGRIGEAAAHFDMTVICVPKDMFAMMLDSGALPDGKVVAVADPRFGEECRARGWTLLERRGARVGRENADEIVRMAGEPA